MMPTPLQVVIFSKKNSSVAAPLSELSGRAGSNGRRARRALCEFVIRQLAAQLACRSPTAESSYAISYRFLHFDIYNSPLFFSLLSGSSSEKEKTRSLDAWYVQVTPMVYPAAREGCRAAACARVRLNSRLSLLLCHKSERSSNFGMHEQTDLVQL